MPNGHDSEHIGDQAKEIARLRKANAAMLAALRELLQRDDDSELGLCDSDGGHPDGDQCVPYPSDELKAAIGLARAAIAAATGETGEKNG